MSNIKCSFPISKGDPILITIKPHSFHFTLNLFCLLILLHLFALDGFLWTALWRKWFPTNPTFRAQNEKRWCYFCLYIPSLFEANKPKQIFSYFFFPSNHIKDKCITNISQTTNLVQGNILSHWFSLRLCYTLCYLWIYNTQLNVIILYWYYGVSSNQDAQITSTF